MPPDSPIRRVDAIPLEKLALLANEDGEVKFCRCWKSKTFPLCDNSHLDHNDVRPSFLTFSRFFPPILRYFPLRFALFMLISAQ